MKRNNTRSPSRHQLIQTGIASVAGAATVELTKGAANAIKTAESAPQRPNSGDRFAGKVVLHEYVALCRISSSAKRYDCR